MTIKIDLEEQGEDKPLIIINGETINLIKENISCARSSFARIDCCFDCSACFGYFACFAFLDCSVCFDCYFGFA